MKYKKRLDRELKIAKELYEWVLQKNLHSVVELKCKIQELYYLLKADVEQYEEEQVKSKIDNAEMPKYVWENGGLRFHADTSRSERDKDVEILSGMCSAYREVIRMLMEQIYLDDQ